jgi:hypothetical protein
MKIQKACDVTNTIAGTARQKLKAAGSARPI